MASQYSPTLTFAAPAPSDTAIPEEEEYYSSWSLFLVCGLLVISLWTSYYLQIKRIRAIHETLVAILAGMFVGLVVRLSPGTMIRDMLVSTFCALCFPSASYSVHYPRYLYSMECCLVGRFPRYNCSVRAEYLLAAQAPCASYITGLRSSPVGVSAAYNRGEQQKLSYIFHTARALHHGILP